MTPDTQPELPWLRTFAAVAETQSLSAAARQLHLSQPAVHAQVQRLAETLNVTLYRREGRGLVLTPDGERVAAFARDVLGRVQGFVGGLRTAEDHQPVTLAAGEGAFLYLLADPIRDFLHHETAPLHLKTLSAKAALQAIRRHEAHLAVVSVDTVPPDLWGQVITRTGAALAVPAAHEWADADTLTLTDLTEVALIVSPRGAPQRNAIERLLARANVPWTVAVEAHGWPLVLQFVRLGLGLAIVNDVVIPPPGVAMVPLQGIPPREYQAVRLPDVPMTPPCERLLQGLLNAD